MYTLVNVDWTHPHAHNGLHPVLYEWFVAQADWFVAQADQGGESEPTIGVHGDDIATNFDNNNGPGMFDVFYALFLQDPTQTGTPFTTGHYIEVTATSGTTVYFAPATTAAPSYLYFTPTAPYEPDMNYYSHSRLEPSNPLNTCTPSRQAMRQTPSSTTPCQLQASRLPTSTPPPK